MKADFKKPEQFSIVVQNKRKNKNIRLQVDNEFQQVKIKDLNYRYNVTMFTTNLSAGKAFAAEHKIRKLKSRTSKLKAISDKTKVNIPPVTIIKQSAENMNDVKSEKHIISTNNIEKNLYLARNLRHLVLKG